MKKRSFMSAIAGFTLLSSLAFANYHDSQSMQTYPPSSGKQDSSQMSCGEWRTQLFEKEGSCVEGGVELLIMTSTLSPTYTDEFFTLVSQPGFFISDRITDSIVPDYNLGFAIDLRYRPQTDNDVGLYYKYIRNNGDDTLKRDVTSFFATFSQQNEQDDKGSLHSHLHIIDFMFGRTYPISDQSVLRVAGGLSYNDLSVSFFYKDDDTLTNRDLLGNITFSTRTIASNHQHNSIWMLGPKLGIDFEYYFLPRCWRHDFNMYLNAEFGLLYGKEWSRGRSISTSIFTTGSNSFEQYWRNKPKFEFFPNINLDMGMAYNYHTTSGVIVKFAAGYRVISYWELDELSRSRFFVGGDDNVFFFGTFTEDHFAYTGPYVRFSVAY